MTGRNHGRDLVYEAAVVASSYLSRLIGNRGVSGYLERHHPEILTEFRAIVAATSLEEGGSGVSVEPALLD